MVHLGASRLGKPSFSLDRNETLSTSNQMTRDISLLKKLEIKQKQLEDKFFNSKKMVQCRKFKAHPNLLQSDSETNASCTPRIRDNNFSSSTTNLLSEKSRGNFALQETKQKAQVFHKLLHEKLCIIDRNPSERSDFSEIGDSHKVSQKSIGDRFQSQRVKSSRSDSSIGSSSLDSDGAFSNSRCKSSDIRVKIKIDKNRIENNISAASKTISGGERQTAASRLSSQQSMCPKGIPSTVFERKFKVVVTKGLQHIADIRTTLAKGVIPPDGEEEESRRVVKAKEFANRFSRNYLYPLARHLKDLDAVNQMNPLLVNQKVLSTYQMLQNALQAYQTHLPTSLDDCKHSQLKILMGNIVEVCVIHRKQLKESEEDYIVEFIDTFKINAELIIQKIEEGRLLPAPSTESALKSEQSKTSLTSKTGGKNNRKRKIPGKSNKLDSRLSMYTMTASFRKDAPWKKAMENLAKKKFNVKSKYRTATYKHRPPIQKDPEIIPLSKFKTLFPNRQLGVLKPTRLNSPINEDCIKTMVEAESNRESHVEREEWENMEKKNESEHNVRSSKEEILMKLLRFTLKNHDRGTDEDDRSQISEILTLIKSEPNDEFLRQVLDGLTDKDGNEKEQDSKQRLTLEIVKSQCSLSDGGISSGEKTKRKEPKITVTGDRNTRLICITDENSVTRPPEDEEVVDNKICQTENAELPKIIIRTSSETQTDLGESSIKNSKATQKGKQSANIKISRLKKLGRNLKPLDKKQALNIIQYKLDFYRYCKSNPMYKASTSCQPWVLMGKLSEELLNLSLLSVAREIEINDVTEKVYQSEIQL